MPDYSLGAIRPEERAILRRELAAMIRELSTPQLLTEIESSQWSLGEIDLRPEAFVWTEESRAWLVWRLRALNEELATRRRISAADPEGAPPIPRDQAAMKDELAEIKRRVDLRGYIETFGRARLERKGRTFWTCCPLPGHEEETPSFHVDPEQGLWHCFGCNRGGDLFAFAQAIHQEPYFWVLLPALRALAGLPQPEPPKPQKPAKSVQAPAMAGTSARRVQVIVR